MSKIKNYAIDMYGEDWTQRLEDIAIRKAEVENGKRR